MHPRNTVSEAASTAAAQRPTAPAAEKLLESFDNTFRAFEEQETLPRIVGACWMRMLWQAFRGEYPLPEDFARASEAVRSDELEKDYALIVKTRRDESTGHVGHGAAFGVRLIYCYKYALALGYSDVALRMAAALEPWNQIAADYDDHIGE
jgi:hypothetical protein